jgi:hypothetical protein
MTAVLEATWKERLIQDYQQRRAEQERQEQEWEEKERDGRFDALCLAVRLLGVPEGYPFRITQGDDPDLIIDGIRFRWLHRFDRPRVCIVTTCPDCGQEWLSASICTPDDLARYLLGDVDTGTWHVCPQPEEEPQAPPAPQPRYRSKEFVTREPEKLAEWLCDMGNEGYGVHSITPVSERIVLVVVELEDPFLHA